MTSSTFADDNKDSPGSVTSGGDFGETDSPDGTAPDVNNPLSEPPYGTDRPELDDSQMRGLAEHGYDGTGNLQSAADGSGNTEETQTANFNSVDQDSGPGIEGLSTSGYTSTGIGNTPGSVMRNVTGADSPEQPYQDYDETGSSGFHAGNSDILAADSTEDALRPSGGDNVSGMTNARDRLENPTPGYGKPEDAGGLGTMDSFGAHARRPEETGIGGDTATSEPFRDDPTDHGDREPEKRDKGGGFMDNLKEKLEEAKESVMGDDQNKRQ